MQTGFLFPVFYEDKKAQESIVKLMFLVQGIYLSDNNSLFDLNSATYFNYMKILIPFYSIVLP